MKEMIIVGLGGFLGSIMRYRASGFILHHSEGWNFPLATFLVNATGCFIIGLIGGLIERHHLFGTPGRLFLFTGLLGGFTTFSAFGYETISLFRLGHWEAATMSIVLSFSCCLLAVIIGEAAATLW